MAALALSGSAAAGTSIADAVAGPSARGRVVSESVLGGDLRAAVWAIPQEKFPTEGDAYAVVSPGDATFLTAVDRLAPCRDDPFGDLDPTGTPMVLCGLGGFELVLELPRYASTLSFSYVYFSTEANLDPKDPKRYQDPFRVFLLADAAKPALVAQSTVPEKPSGLAFLARQDVTVNIADYAGQQIALQFLAANQWDWHSPSGALVDGLEITEAPPPPVSTAS
ncbi:MAG: hypothetical protein ACJ78Y_19965, partial [Myxococcales bacterium]